MPERILQVFQDTMVRMEKKVHQEPRDQREILGSQEHQAPLESRMVRVYVKTILTCAIPTSAVWQTKSVIETTDAIA